MSTEENDCTTETTKINFLTVASENDFECKPKPFIKNNSALNVMPGVEQPPTTNKSAIDRFKAKRKQKLTVQQYIDGILKQDITILSKAITLVESSLPVHREMAQQIIERCLPYTGNSIRIGITGVPGVGKSTFIEALGTTIASSGHKLAVLAIDPSSERSHGSILGDKTRMEELSAQPNAFIRPSPSAGSLGGVANKTRESMLLCEAAGYEVIFIETVGVGQSETAVHGMVDFFLLLMLAGAGDELQGIKRGIMEMADGIAITKTDSGNESRATMAQAQYKNALHLFPPTQSGWKPEVLTCSSVYKNGIQEIWEMLLSYKKHCLENKHFEYKRQQQAKDWMLHSIEEGLKNNFFENETVKLELSKLEQRIIKGKMSPYIAAKQLLDNYHNSI